MRMDARSALQLDIFEHSRDVMLRNDLAQAVLQADAAAACLARDALAAEFPLDPALACAPTLIAALEPAIEQALPTAEAASAAQLALDQTVAIAARRLLGADQAAPWLALRWRQLARRAAALPYLVEQAEAHAAALWLRAGAWQEVADAAANIESWRCIPTPLAWMVQARWHLAGLDAAWPLLAELAWLAPQRFEPLARSLPDPVLHKLLRRFGTAFVGDGASDDLAWFPAWVLTDEPRLAGPLGLAEPSRQTEPEQAMQLMLALLRLERQGRQREVIEHRRRLQGLHAGLFACYMKPR